jgi:hypothetical protein
MVEEQESNVMSEDNADDLLGADSAQFHGMDTEDDAINDDYPSSAHEEKKEVSDEEYLNGNDEGYSGDELNMSCYEDDEDTISDEDISDSEEEDTDSNVEDDDGQNEDNRADETDADADDNEWRSVSTLPKEDYFTEIDDAIEARRIAIELDRKISTSERIRKECNFDIISDIREALRMYNQKKELLPEDSATPFMYGSIYTKADFATGVNDIFNHYAIPLNGQLELLSFLDKMCLDAKLPIRKSKRGNCISSVQQYIIPEARTLTYDYCVNGCFVFAGAMANEDVIRCPRCNEERFHKWTCGQKKCNTCFTNDTDSGCSSGAIVVASWYKISSYSSTPI